jgi:two-component system chemotaxis response regulator CheY
MTQKRKPRVLIADDELHIRTMVKAVMKTMNAEVVGEAVNGQEAVTLFENVQPDLTLLDINMPVKTGEEALKEIIKKNPNAFVIMLTSLSDLKTVEKCLELGASNFIRKDTPISEIKKIIKETWMVMKS